MLTVSRWLASHPPAARSPDLCMLPQLCNADIKQETPGLSCLRSAHIDLEGLTLDREVRALYVPNGSSPPGFLY